MDINCGLVNESYKAIYGINNIAGFNKFNAPFDETDIFKVTCAKNDWATAQLLLFSQNEMMVCVNGDTCFYEQGPIDIVRIEVDVPGIEKENVSVQLVGLVEDDDRQKKSDILYEKPFIYVERRKTQPVWIEVKTSKEIAEGKYVAKISVLRHRMFEKETVLKKLTFEINVVNVTLDDPARYSFYLDLWQHNSNIARKYDLELWSGKHFEIMENYVASLAELGQKSISVIVSEVPWSGQRSFYAKDYCSNLFEYNIIKVSKDINGNWKYDFSAMNRYIELCMKYGINDEIEVFGLANIWMFEDAGFGKVIEDYNDGVRIRYYDEASKTYDYIRSKKEFALYIKALESNFIEKGWIDKVRILGDEPESADVFESRMGIIRQYAPQFKFKVAINNVSFIDNEIEGVTDYVPILPAICEEYDKAMGIRNKIKGKFVYYVCCGPLYPNSFICSPLTEARMIPWISWKLGLDGFLRWNYTVWPDDPLNRISYFYPAYRAGDTNFVYPGKDGKPLLTLRYKNLKRGIRDYEIFKKYCDLKCSRAELEEKLKKVFYWEKPSEIYTAKSEPVDLYSMEYENFESIVEDILLELSYAFMTKE